MASKPPVLIITGYGLNCEAESRYAWEQAGAQARLVHLHDLLDKPGHLHEYAALMFIGGFSYGDHMSSGHVFALRLRNRLRDDLQRFIDEKKLMLGVCNGFQIMIKLGLLPGLNGEYFDQRLALMQNDCGAFQNFWIDLRFEPASPCVFTRGLDRMSLPIRHGEGKIFTPRREVLAAVEKANGVACRYIDPETMEPAHAFPHNPNGSLNAIAGLCDPTGRVFGMMPHPEAFLFPWNDPHWDRAAARGEDLPDAGAGLRIFQNAVSYLA